MRRSIGSVEILSRTQGPGKGLRGPSSFTGQLLVDPTSGTYFKSLESGPNALWEQIFLSNQPPSPAGQVDPDIKIREFADDVYDSLFMPILPPNDVPTVVWSDGLTSSFASPVTYRPNIVGKGSKTDNWNSVTGTPDPNFYFDPGYFETSNGPSQDLEMHGEYKFGGASQAAAWNVAFEFATSSTDAFELGIYDTGNSAFIIEVGGIQAGYYSVPPGLAAGKKVTITFPRVGTRYIRISGLSRLAYVWMKTGASITKPTMSRRRGAIFGDSYVGGAGGPYSATVAGPDRGAGQISTFAPEILKVMGSNSHILAGIGGTGFVATAQPYITRVPEVLDLNPNFIFASGSINDPSNGAGVQAAVEAFLEATDSVSERYISTVTRAEWTACSAAIRAAVNAYGNGVKLLDIEGIFYGSGNSISGGTGTRSIFMMSDGSHPTYQGHRLIARQLARQYFAVNN